MTHPTDDLLRAYVAPEAVELRASADGDGNTLHGHFAVFNDWTEINSVFEGRFLERIAPGAFARTFAERGDQVRVLYDHGHDPSVGNKPLGTIVSLTEDKRGASYEVDLFDTNYVNELKPAIRAGQMGASFRFRVTAEEWADPTRSSQRNPDKIPERTITDVDLYEFGPVTFPAYASATAGMRSRTDEFIDYLADPLFVARLSERVGLKVVEHLIAKLPVGHRSDDDTPEAPAGGRDEAPQPTPRTGRLVASAQTDLRKIRKEHRSWTS
jgi:HK97 family phage prohead protease